MKKSLFFAALVLACMQALAADVDLVTAQHKTTDFLKSQAGNTSTIQQYNNTTINKVKAHYVNGIHSDWSNIEEVTLFENTPEFVRGDVNGNGLVDMDDLTALINYLLDSTSPINTPGAASCTNAEDTTEVDMDDLSSLVNYLLENQWLEEHNDDVGSLTLLHLSDTHASGRNGSLQRASQLMNAQNSPYSLCVISGDCYSSMEYWIQMSLGEYNTSLSGDKLMLCAGNHDAYPNGTYTSAGLAGWQTQVTASIKSKTTSADIVWGDKEQTPKSSYCYRDIVIPTGENKTRKVRFIVLDQYELDAVGVPTNINDQYGTAYSRFRELYSATQIQWFIDVLKSLQTDGVDYFAVVLHSPPVTDTESNMSALQGKRRINKFIAATNGSVTSGSTYVDVPYSDYNWGSSKGSVWAKIIDAYLNRQETTVAFHNFMYGDPKYNTDPNDYVSVTADFSETTPVSFLFYLCGHMHREYIGYHPEYPNQLIMAIDASKTNDWNGDLSRPSTWAEDIVINEITLDFATRKITINRIGNQTVRPITVQGVNYPATTRDTITFNFKKGQEDVG